MEGTTTHFREWMDIESGPRNALLIDDSKEDTDLIIQTSKGFRVRWDVAHNGKDALEMIAEKRKYHLVVLDLVLNSQPDGVDLYRKIKDICPLCPVLIFSGYITSEVMSEITSIGFAMFAPKPTSFTSSFFDQLFTALNISKIGNQSETKAGYAI